MQARRLALLLVLAFVPIGCGIRPCVELCRAEADCVQAEIDAQGSTWPAWTGFPDREGYEEACFAVFDESLATSTDPRARRRLKKLCRAEADRGCGG